MAHIVQEFGQLTAMLSAPRAIALVSVPWSPWPRKSRETLASLESTREEWSPDCTLEFFDLWPERDEALNRWYEQLWVNWPELQVHGNGYGPFWWLIEGRILDCLSKPYEYSLEQLRQRSVELFRARQ